MRSHTTHPFSPYAWANVWRSQHVVLTLHAVHVVSSRSLYHIICTVYIHGIHAPNSNDRRRIWEHCRIVGLLTGLVPCSVRIQDICHITHSVADTWKWDWGSDLHVHMLSAKAGYCFHPQSARTGSLLRIVHQDKQHRHKELDNDEEVVQLGPQKTKK